MWLVILILANLPLPVVLYLNWRVTVKFLRVRKLTHKAKLKHPPRLAIGWVLSNLAIIFVAIPAITERRLLVEDPRWLGSYAVAAALTIGGLLLMDSALNDELKRLGRRGQAKTRR